MFCYCFTFLVNILSISVYICQISVNICQCTEPTYICGASISDPFALDMLLYTNYIALAIVPSWAEQLYRETERKRNDERTWTMRSPWRELPLPVPYVLSTQYRMYVQQSSQQVYVHHIYIYIPFGFMRPSGSRGQANDKNMV